MPAKVVFGRRGAGPHAINAQRDQQDQFETRTANSPHHCHAEG